MSSALWLDLAVQSIDKSLLHLAVKGDDASAEGISIGPFGVFSAHQLKAASLASPLPLSGDDVVDFGSGYDGIECGLQSPGPYQSRDNIETYSMDIIISHNPSLSNTESHCSARVRAFIYYETLHRRAWTCGCSSTSQALQRLCRCSHVDYAN